MKKNIYVLFFLVTTFIFLSSCSRNSTNTIPASSTTKEITETKKSRAEHLNETTTTFNDEIPSSLMTFFSKVTTEKNIIETTKEQITLSESDISITKYESQVEGNNSSEIITISTYDKQEESLNDAQNIETVTSLILTTTTPALTSESEYEEIFKSGWTKADVIVEDIIFDNIDYDSFSSRQINEMECVTEKEKYLIRMPVWAKYKFNKGDTVIMRLVYDFSDSKKPYLCAFDKFQYYNYNTVYKKCREFQKVLYIKDNVLALDEMLDFYNLEWSDMESPFFSYSSEDRIYGLFGCYNEIDNDSDEYIYRNGMSCDKLIELMRFLNDERIAYIQNEKEHSDDDNTTHFNSIYHNDYMAGSIWVKVTINDIF